MTSRRSVQVSRPPTARCFASYCSPETAPSSISLKRGVWELCLSKRVSASSCKGKGPEHGGVNCDGQPSRPRGDISREARYAVPAPITNAQRRMGWTGGAHRNGSPSFYDHKTAVEFVPGVPDVIIGESLSYVLVLRGTLAPTATMVRL
jgi:hypothetical protein